MSRRRKFFALSWRGRVVFFQSLLMLPATALSIKVLGVQRWQNALARLTQKGNRSSAHNSHNSDSSDSSAPVRIKEAREIARLVRAAANHSLYRANCLEQSLVLWSLLKRSGLDSQIRFGARKEENELQAHAWIECLGVALNEDRGVEERYAPFGGVAIAPNGSVVSGSVRSR
ncbi:MAG: lasso peptide biosynthesis B2 protein [Pyrinomonadaceae bacterium]